MSALLQREGAAPSAPAVAAVSLALIAIGFVFAPVAFQMISIWNTYNYQHCYLVPITACWLCGEIGRRSTALRGHGCPACSFYPAQDLSPHWGGS